MGKLLGSALLGGGVAAPAESPETVYLRDTFAATESAPMVSPHAATVTGTATLLDTTSKMSTDGAFLRTTGGNAINDPQYYDAQRTNAAGRYMYFKQEVRDTFTSGGYFGLSSVVNANAPNPLAFQDAFNLVTPYVNFASYDHGLSNGRTVNTAYDYVPTYLESLIVSTNPGALWFQRHKQGDWMLIYADETLTATNLYARLTSLAKKFWGDEFQSGAFATAGMFATFSKSATAFKASSANNDTITAAANAVIRHTITAATGVTQEMLVRRVDDSNCWIIRMSQSGSTIKLIEVVGGVETERASAAQTWTNGTAYRIQVTADYRNIRASVNATHKVAWTAALSNLSATGVKVSHAGVNLIAYPRRYAIGGFTAAAQKLFLPYGDSKTNGQGDDNPPPLGENGYPYYLATSLGGNWKETARIARSGYTVAQSKAVVDADIAARYDAPDYILCNLGANDVASMPLQATFESEYGYILDAFHERFPSARIGLMRPWRQNFDSDCNTLATWIGNVVSARSSYAFLGPDERVFLKGSDNGATYTSDGIHPNHPGYVLTGAEWRASLSV